MRDPLAETATFNEPPSLDQAVINTGNERLAYANKCDGNHGGPPCADPNCWNDTATAEAISELDDPFAFPDPEDDPEAVTLPEKMFRIPSGKYKGLVLPVMSPIKPTFFDKVMALKDEVEQDPEFQRQAGTIAQTYAQLRREAEVVAKQLSEIKLRLSAVMLLMIDQFENEGEAGLTLQNGDKIRWQPEPHLVVTDKEAFRQQCLARGLERDMVLPWSKANSLVKAMLINGEPQPDGAECFMRPKVFFSRGDK